VRDNIGGGVRNGGGVTFFCFPVACPKKLSKVLITFNPSKVTGVGEVRHGNNEGS
jgi:hypothetical protein